MRRRFDHKEQTAFTIVELLIVVVVIAILAAITVVAYNGIRNRAQTSAQASALSQVDKKLRTHAIENNGAAPASLESMGFVSSGDTNYEYQTEVTSPSYYCSSVKVGSSARQFISSKNERPAGGSCRDLVGWWPFNSDTTDYGRYNYASSGSGYSSTTGQNSLSGAYEFNGGYMTIPGFEHSVLRAANGGQSASWTFSAWVQANSTTQSNESIIVGRSGCHGGLYTYSNQYRLAVKTSVSGNCWTGALEVGSQPIDTEWRHLVGVYQGGTMQIYIDGSLAASGTFASTMYSYGSELRIGGYPGRTFAGKIDDVRVYARALSADEVADMYKGGAF